MKIQLSGKVEYRPEYVTRGDEPWHDPQSVMIWLSETRRMVEQTAGKLRQLTKEQVGIRVIMDQENKTAVVIGEADE